jgi:hypothetical protein
LSQPLTRRGPHVPWPYAPGCWLKSSHLYWQPTPRAATAPQPVRQGCRSPGRMLLNHNVRRTHQTCAIRRLSRQVRLCLQSHRLQQEPVRRLRFRQLLLRLASRPRQACRGRSTSSGLPWQASPSGVLARGILNTQRPKGGLCHPTTTASTSTRTSPSASVSSTSRPRHAGRGKLLNPATPSCRHPDKLTLPSPGSGASSAWWPNSAIGPCLGRLRGGAWPCSGPMNLHLHWLWLESRVRGLTALAARRQ